jgi:hypothetical protein
MSENIDSIKLFPRYPTGATMKERIDIWVIRHDNNFFLDKDPQEITIAHELDDFIKPYYRVTKQLLNKHVTVDKRAKINKVSWVLKRDEEFAREFKQKYESNEFKNQTQIENGAAVIYSNHCPDYKKDKATVIKVDGEVIRKKKRPAESEEPKSQFTKEMCLNAIKENFDKLNSISKLSTIDLKQKINDTNDDNTFVNSIPAITEPKYLNERILHQFIATIHHIIQNINV